MGRPGAPRVRLARGRILFCLDDDESGSKVGAAAVDVCRAAGLDLARALVIVDLDPHHDLTDAFAAGWRA